MFLGLGCNIFIACSYKFYGLIFFFFQKKEDLFIPKEGAENPITSRYKKSDMQLKNLFLKTSICFGLILTSCQSAKELHYFKVGDNYYRLKISEFAFMSSSRYISGYFDENAVDRYFGEITRPDTAKANFVKPVHILNDGTVAANAKLVLILSTNSNAITDQINALASNDQTLELMARLANKDAIKETSTLKNQINTENAKINSTIAAGVQYINTTEAITLTGSNLKKDMLTFINSVASYNGYKIQFTNLKEAEIWYQTAFAK